MDLNDIRKWLIITGLIGLTTLSLIIIFHPSFKEYYWYGINLLIILELCWALLLRKLK